jgi:hypothetical protein
MGFIEENIMRSADGSSSKFNVSKREERFCGGE